MKVHISNEFRSFLAAANRLVGHCPPLRKQADAVQDMKQKTGLRNELFYVFFRLKRSFFI